VNTGRSRKRKLKRKWTESIERERDTKRRAKGRRERGKKERDVLQPERSEMKKKKKKKKKVIK
jgi:hypothetical protein